MARERDCDSRTVYIDRLLLLPLLHNTIASRAAAAAAAAAATALELNDGNH